MLDSSEYAHKAETEAKGYPALAQVYATLAIAAAVKENRQELLEIQPQVYPGLVDLRNDDVESEYDLQVESWINGGTKDREED